MGIENLAEKKKEAVPQIDEVSGLSSDYNNAFKSFLGYNPERMDECVEWFVEDARAELTKNPNGLFVQKYTERYSSADYKDVVTERNKEDIEYIDSAVGKIQQFYQDNIRPHLLKSQDLEPEVKNNIIALVKETKVLMKRVSDMIEGEVVAVPGEDLPLNIEYLHEIASLTEPSTPAEDWYARIHERMVANDGKALPTYVEKIDVAGVSKDHASPRHQKRIQRVNGIITSLNKALSSSGMSEVMEKNKVGMVVKIIRPTFLKKMAIITRMIKAEAA